MYLHTYIYTHKYSNYPLIFEGDLVDKILEISAVATGLEKVSFHSSSKERQCQRMLKLPHNSLISHASKVMLKILQARLQKYVNHELPDVQAGFRKGRGTRD